MGSLLQTDKVSSNSVRGYLPLKLLHRIASRSEYPVGLVPSLQFWTGTDAYLMRILQKSCVDDPENCGKTMFAWMRKSMENNGWTVLKILEKSCMIIRKTSKIQVYLSKIVLGALEMFLDENLRNSGSLHVIFCIFYSIEWKNEKICYSTKNW